jgi:acyl carrier protein
MNEIEKEIFDIVIELLEIESVAIDQLTREQYASWDSLKHLEIIMTIEEEFDIRFTPGEIADIQSAKEIASLIKGKLYA